MDLIALLAQNYIRWRHGIVGSADKPTFDATEKALTEAAGVDVSTLDDVAIMALFAKADPMQAVQDKWREATQLPPVPTPTKRTRKDSGASSTGSN